MREPPERVYVIGHPAGRGLEISLQDNLMLACDGRHVHYRAPTEGGSSGSPVFDRNWQVIALHHGGGTEVRRLDQERRTLRSQRDRADCGPACDRQRE